VGKFCSIALHWHRVFGAQTQVPLGEIDGVGGGVLGWWCVDVLFFGEPLLEEFV
jgi:hypothetical protein